MLALVLVGLLVACTRGQMNDWITSTPPPISIPKNRVFHAAVVIGDYMVVYGGLDREMNALNDTLLWQFSENTWMTATSKLTPPARFSAAFAANGTHLFIFGGATGIYPSFVPLADTWVFAVETQEWSLVDSTINPCARWGAAGLYGDDFIIFGGYKQSIHAGSKNSSNNEVWQLDLNLRVWNNITTIGRHGFPEPRGLTSFISVNGFGYLVAGCATAGISPSNLYIQNPCLENSLSDTWSFDLFSYHWVLMTKTSPILMALSWLAPFPDCNSSFLAYYDGPNYISSVALFNITTATWEEMPSNSLLEVPSGRQGGSFVCHFNMCYLFGSFAPTTYAYSFAERSWTPVVSNFVPTPRLLSSANIFNGSVISFAGQGRAPLDDLWIWNSQSSSWLEIHNGCASWPCSRYAHASVIVNQTMYLFGGADGWNPQPLNDCWSLSLLTYEWTRLFCQNAPSARYGHRMTAIGPDLIFMFGGGDDTLVPLNDTWLWNLATNNWTRLHPSVAPAGRVYHTMATFTNRQVVVFGGLNFETYAAFSDVWAFNLMEGNWTSLSLAPNSYQPTARSQMASAMIGCSKLMVSGGCLNWDSGQASSEVLFGTFETATTWMWQLVTTSSFIPRFGHSSGFLSQNDDHCVSAMGYGSTNPYAFVLYGDSENLNDDDSLNYVTVPALQIALPGCNPGTFATKISLTCETCPPGTFSASAGATKCTLCPAGSVPSSNSTSCNLCSVGFFASNNGSTGCEPCPIGTYTASEGTVQCESCPFGTTTETSASNETTDCMICSESFCEHGASCYVSAQSNLPACDCSWSYSTSSRCGNLSPMAIGLASGLASFVIILLISIGVFVFWRRMRIVHSSLRGQLIEQEQEFENSWKISESEVVLQNQIGRGSYGEVWIAKWGDRPVAVKKLLNMWNDTNLVSFSNQNDHGDSSDLSSRTSTLDRVHSGFRDEIKLIRRIKHINIVLCYGAGKFADGCLFLVLEYCTRGALSSLLHDERTEWPWFRQIEIALHASRGLEFLHGMKPISIHRDIKSPNILVSEGWIAKIADFGSAKLLDHDPDVPSPSAAAPSTPMKHGSLLWSAPEILHGQQHSTRSDVYSIGIVFFEVVTRSYPFEEIASLHRVEAAIKQGARPIFPTPIQPEFRTLIDACWHHDQSRRPPIGEVVQQLELLNQLPPPAPLPDPVFQPLAARISSYPKDELVDDDDVVAEDVRLLPSRFKTL